MTDETERFVKSFFGAVTKNGRLHDFVQDIDEGARTYFPKDGVIVRLGSMRSAKNRRHIPVTLPTYQRRFALLKLCYQNPQHEFLQAKHVLLRFTDTCTGWIEIDGKRQTLHELRQLRQAERKRINGVSLREFVLCRYQERGTVTGEITLGDITVSFTFKDVALPKPKPLRRGVRNRPFSPQIRRTATS